MKRKILLYAPPEYQEPVRTLDGVGSKGAEALAESKFRIRTVQDLLQHYPRRHLDFTETKSIREVEAGDEVTVVAEVARVTVPPPPSKRTRFKRLPIKVELHEGTSRLEIAFFNQRWRANQLKVGTLIAAKGKVTKFGKKFQMTNPMVDVVRDAQEAILIVPIYPSTADLHTAFLRRIIRSALLAHSPLEDPLPESIKARHHLLDRTTAMSSYHFPSEMADKWEARKRLVFDELFTLQIGLAFRKRRIEEETIGISHKVELELATRFVESLPFTLTDAQRKAISEIEEDMGRGIPMHRLLQGEVGSGKTVVALHAALLAVQGGYQAAIMAPTEVLASQHYLTVTNLLGMGSGNGDRLGQLDFFGAPKVVLLTGGVGAARRREALSGIADGSAQIVIGTHALIQEAVDFANLGFAVVDEQHRFGVRQRMDLRDKSRGGATPDVLIMTATPIPRTLSLTLYGDLDVSVLDELPKGRKPVKTEIIEENDRQRAYDQVRDEVRAGRQAYVITPLVDESEKLEVKAAEVEAKRLAEEVFPDLRVGLMHGRLTPVNKERVMDGFRRGEIDVLISTTVVEVGVDVPNATVMLIEDADRFGLSQLHQLRGRIGRGEHESTCLLLTGAFDGGPEDKANARQRLEAMATTNDGFKLAQKDLELRGAGTILGERQSGWSDLRLTDWRRDIEALKSARKEAFRLIESDHDLSQHPLIRLEMEGRFADRLEWLFYS